MSLLFKNTAELASLMLSHTQGTARYTNAKHAGKENAPDDVVDGEVARGVHQARALRLGVVRIPDGVSAREHEGLEAQGVRLAKGERVWQRRARARPSLHSSRC